MEYSIVFIAPYKKLGELFSETCRELNRNIPVLIGDLEEGARLAVKLEEQGVDAVISRGGTAMAIRREVTDLPVIEVQVGGFDLLRILQQVKQESNRVVVAGFNTFTYGVESLQGILGIEIKVLTLKEEWYNQQHFIEERLKKVKEENYNLVVGDNISVKIAKILGMNAYLIRSGKEALIQSIFEAERVVKVRKQEMEKAKNIKSIIDYAYEGIISIDQEGNIDIFNPTAEEILQIKSYKVIGRNINAILPEMNLHETFQTGYQENDRILTVKGIKIVANIIPIKINEEVVRVISIFQKVSRIQKVEQKIREEIHLKGHVAENTFDDIIGTSVVINRVKEEARDYAQLDAPILIYGETGTGKEFFAQAIHNTSFRRNKPFVAFNCAALPTNLIESELFGYVEGAFTGAVKNGIQGLFEQTHEGTIFLDEIGEISLETQIRLLRVIQENKIRKLGDDKLIPVNVRIIIATNNDLQQLIRENRFREDLYYRINVLNLNIPPLRERKDDIPLLVNFFIRKYEHKINRVIKGISAGGMRLLKNYHWPGNVRQLENVVERLMIRAKEGYIMTNLVK
jgi:PAS domain S-box-containing protein